MAEVKKLPYKTYLAVINNSINSNMFKEVYAKIDGRTVDVTRQGELSCAFFVSSILKMFNVAEGSHATVKSTVEDLEKSKWQKTETPSTGDVVVWKAIKFPNGEEHEHIGFVIGKNEAISNDFVSGTPQKHRFDQTPDGTKRQIDAVYHGRHLFEAGK